MYESCAVCSYICVALCYMYDFSMIRTVQITHNLNGPRVWHACHTKSTRMGHMCDTHTADKKHVRKSYLRVHMCKMLHTRIKIYTCV